jgi:DNA invertase Pin-like site-specific DNA recombinase
MFALDNYKDSGKIYDAAIYLRLSREDEVTGQSASIENQKAYLMNYVVQQGWNIIDIYIDDGFTGLNFDRPAFKKLVSDIEDKKINLVITKDLSRLGRDYIDTGYYIERYFPQKNVRYIALNDGIDTFTNTSNNDISPFKSVLNDMYAKDISKKIRIVMDTKRTNGQFIGAFAPYGYIKDKDNKNKLVIDEIAALVVKRIFSMYASGSGMSEIVRVLNREKVPTPTEYKNKIQNLSYVNVNIKFYVWRMETIKRILTNPTYIGNMAQRRAEKINYKVKKFRKIPQTEWIVAENTHEAIIDKDTFQVVQALIGKKAQAYYPNRVEHLLSGNVFCAQCGMPMTFRRLKSGEFVLICSGYSRFGKTKCERNTISEEVLNEQILSELKQIADKAICKEDFFNQCSAELSCAKVDDTTKELEQIQKRQNAIRKIIKSLYEDKVNGILSEEDFLSMSAEYSDEKETLANRFQDLSERAKNKPMEQQEYFKYLKDIAEFKTTEKTVIGMLVKRIEVYRNKDVAVYYNFKNPFQIANT